MPKRRSEDLTEKLERGKRKVKKLEEQFKNKSDDNYLGIDQPAQTCTMPDVENLSASPPRVLSPGDWTFAEDSQGLYEYTPEYDHMMWITPSSSNQPWCPAPPDAEPAPAPVLASVLAQAPEQILPSTSTEVPTAIAPAPVPVPLSSSAPIETNVDATAAAIISADIPTNCDPLLLDADLLEILGEDPADTIKLGPEIRPELANRLRHIVCNGLTKAQRKELIEKYPLPVNCQIIGAPAVNPEMKIPIPPAVTNRDKGIEAKQNQIASAISCLGEVMTFLLNSKEKNNFVLQKTMDACRILCDLQHSNSVTRRNFMLFPLRPDKKEQLLNTKIDTFLFGEDLGKTLLSANTVSKTAAGLKPLQTKRVWFSASNPTSKHLNQRPLPARRLPAAPRAPAATARDYEPAATRSYEPPQPQRPRPRPPPPPPPPPHAHSSRRSHQPPPPPPHYRSRRWY